MRQIDLSTTVSHGHCTHLRHAVSPAPWRAVIPTHKCIARQILSSVASREKTGYVAHAYASIASYRPSCFHTPRRQTEFCYLTNSTRMYMRVFVYGCVFDEHLGVKIFW